MLAEWRQHVDELRNQYHWLLFFSMPKILLLYRLLKEENPNLGAIVHGISFLCRNQQAAWKNAQVEVSSGWNKTEACRAGGRGACILECVGILEPLSRFPLFATQRVVWLAGP